MKILKQSYFTAKSRTVTGKIRISSISPETDQTNRVYPLVRPNNSCESRLPQDSKPLAFGRRGSYKAFHKGILSRKPPSEERTVTGKIRISSISRNRSNKTSLSISPSKQLLRGNTPPKTANPSPLERGLLQNIPQRNSFTEVSLRRENCDRKDTHLLHLQKPIKQNESVQTTPARQHSPQDSKPLAFGTGERITQIKSPNNEVLNAPLARQ
ncbi:hypothetical protein CDAR_48701 [Caerostris darwini]|uniref:Uncharacterized protein n=1 Tax=Caerostris darwini TaxID=1538125 RepID=A0AAV4NLX5_9ARAC|nr:hypothetical protein CDAR_48701 [Caerostris darwini]